MSDSENSSQSSAEPSAEEILGRHRATAELQKKWLMPNLGPFRRSLIKLPKPSYLLEDIPETDLYDSLAESSRKREKGEKLTPQETERLEAFGSWRDKLIRYEMECEGNVLCLLRAAEHFDAIGDDAAAYNLLAFAGTEYEFHTSSVPTTHEERSRIAKRAAHRLGRQEMPDRFVVLGYHPPKICTQRKPERITEQECFEEIF